jgi:hypothetical protein
MIARAALANVVVHEALQVDASGTKRVNHDIGTHASRRRRVAAGIVLGTVNDSATLLRLGVREQGRF